MSPLLLGVLAVFLTSWYQQRMTFLQALRSLWSHMIEAKVAMLAYAATPTKTNEAYRSAYRQISRAIEGDIDGNGSPDITLRPTAQLLRTCCVHSGLQIASSDNRLHALALAGFHTGVELEPAPTPQDPWQVAVLCRRHTCHTVEIAAPVVFILGGLLLIEGGAAILGVPALGLGILMLVAMLLFD